MKLKIAVASVLAASSMAAMAADQSFNVTADVPFHFDGKNALFDGGSDLLSFTGLAAGKYDVKISLSGTAVSFDGKATTLNGANATTVGVNTPMFSFLGLNVTGDSPFTLDLVGSVTGSLKDAAYSGQISFTNVSPVPEPATYGMLLGGLGVMGFLARRKSKQA